MFQSIIDFETLRDPEPSNVPAEWNPDFHVRFHPAPTGHGGRLSSGHGAVTVLTGIEPPSRYSAGFESLLEAFDTFNLCHADDTQRDITIDHPDSLDSDLTTAEWRAYQAAEPKYRFTNHSGGRIKRTTHQAECLIGMFEGLGAYNGE